MTPLMLVTCPTLKLVETISAAVEGGINVVYWRDETSHHAELEILHAKLRQILDGRALLISNIRRFHGVGLQLREQDYVWPHRAKREEAALGVSTVGKSVHSVLSAQRAKQYGADYLVAGTVYPSGSHPDLPGQGVGYLREVCEAVAPLPVIAIGGITPERVGECIAAGAAGVAVLSPIMRAEDPRAVAQRYREELDRAWNLRSMGNL